MTRNTLWERWRKGPFKLHASDLVEELASEASRETEALHERCDRLSKSHDTMLREAAGFAEDTTNALSEMRNLLEKERAERIRLQVDILNIKDYLRTLHVGANNN